MIFLLRASSSLYSVSIGLFRRRRWRSRARRCCLRWCGRCCPLCFRRSPHSASRRAFWRSLAQYSSPPHSAPSKWGSGSRSQQRCTRATCVCATSCGTRARCSPISLCFRRRMQRIARLTIVQLLIVAPYHCNC